MSKQKRTMSANQQGEVRKTEFFSHSGNHFQPPGMAAIACCMLANHRKLAKPTWSIAPVQTVWHYSQPVTAPYNPLLFPHSSERIGDQEASSRHLLRLGQLCLLNLVCSNGDRCQHQQRLVVQRGSRQYQSLSELLFHVLTEFKSSVEIVLQRSGREVDANKVQVSKVGVTHFRHPLT